MAALLNDHELTERIFAHAANRGTDLGAEIWREPVANYRDAARLEAELALLRRTPTPFCPSASLPEPGSYLAREAAGVPIIVVRGDDGKVRAFQNVCRHRGMRIADGAGCAKALVCPYHGWTYGLDGALRFVPHEQAGFPDLNKSTHGLKQVHAAEHGGLVFVTQEGEPDAGYFADIPALIGADQLVYSSGVRETPANWKIMLEGFLEGYHIRTTHPESFLPYGFDNLNVVETFGRHARVVFPFKRIEKLRDVPAGERDVSGYVTLVYHIFPNVQVIRLSNHTVVLVLEPKEAGRTDQVAYVLTNQGRGDDALTAAKKDMAFVSQTGAEEDRAMVMAIQRGLTADANDAFTFGRFEGAIVHLHKNLAAALGG
ncbi:MAG TPA: (2Fe-2S)-binding protein [Hyphomonadaceae bacterium]|nr:(2Fe-2S)-binding protein [Hyphomonadaceae bacterium]